ncbi:MAG: DNA-directed RNA polymerase subunit delta [Spiroplasma poulsonii]|uniref:RNAP delta factor n=1 Tax=Spiroplasma poulsonii TaxID=2138 RepID=A0A2P6FB27_9MOLU|nr:MULTISPECIES: DNA-directed RNA polymerase subunit delta [Spiroplasma]KAF0851073.1 DNA-directed RNA polymerase subunit delta [Spiroplasma poulsonii]MBH8622570.1 DNA-directed RNA polymerase subunit delta [Spiroplasma sp. hyd1]MBW1241414.1 DNA-directed RNA polymerase subunit delta [Spiroplasma poulsonii]PQM30668.1 DNA-directed RNA polymerase subunit delta [Spiroplasma poulsonii]PWF95649.1 DNA-directed RNA polymerase subunit delta [Spiroplasma poulsonii]
MNDSVELLELVYLCLKKKGGSDTFENIWNEIASQSAVIVHGTSKEDVIAELYTDLVLDNRFVLTSEGMWGLREFLKYDDIKKQYDYTDQFETTEEFEDIDLDEEEEDEEEESLIDTLDFDDTLDEDDNEEDDFVKIEVEDDELTNDYSVDDDDETVAAKLGITEEIDWKALEKEMEENN